MDNTGKFWGLHNVSFFSDSCNNSGHTMSLWRNAEVERFICGWGQCVLKLFTLCADLCGTAVRVCLCTSCRKFYKDTGNPRVLLWCAPASFLPVRMSSHKRHKCAWHPRVLLWCVAASLLVSCISSHMRHKDTGHPRVQSWCFDT